MNIEGFSFFDSFYMTIITISTVGFNEVHQLSDGGRFFTAFLIITSFGIFAYAIGAISSYVLNGEFRRYYKERKLEKTIGNLKDHVIVCGFGRNGRRAVQEFIAHKTPFVVIENEKEISMELVEKNDILFIDGDAREDEVLLKANIKKARALISTLPYDADNLLTVLTARELNKDLIIISKAALESNYRKLKLAGANNVIMPHVIGGAQMASMIIKPDVIEFFDQIIMQNPEEPVLKEVLCRDLAHDDSVHTIMELRGMKKAGVTIIGMKSENGEYVINPSNDTKLKPGSKLFVLGTPEQISSL